MIDIKDLKVKIIVGFRKEQHYIIDADEAHKAYYLFLNPDKRGVFNNGVAVIGQDIRGIEPDYNSALGYLPTYQLDGYDWNEIRDRRLDRQYKHLMVAAQRVAKEQPEKIAMPLSEIAGFLEAPVKVFKGMTSLSELLPKEVKENDEKHSA